MKRPISLAANARKGVPTGLPRAIIAVCGVVGVLGCIGLALQPGLATPSYLAAWLFWMALPLGALPIVLVADLVAAGGALLLVLRRMLLLMLPGALLAIPLMVRSDTLYRRPGGLPDAWMTHGAFAPRMTVLLAVWCVLAVVFSQTPRSTGTLRNTTGTPSSGGRGGLALLGLLLHVSMASLAAIDWVMSLQPGLGSSAFGLLLMTSQMAIAASAALLVLAVEDPVIVPSHARTVLACVLGGWAFLHLSQYLVVWSANLPSEIVWYQLRTGGLGGAAIWLTAACTLAALLVLPGPLTRLPLAAACCAGILLFVHGLEVLWLITPVFRGGFVLNWQDGFAVLGLAGIALALLLLAAPRTFASELRHEPA